MSVEQLEIQLPSDPEARSKVKDALKEMVDSMARAAAEKTLQKEIIDVVYENNNKGIPKKVFRQWAKWEFNDSLDKTVGELSESEVNFRTLMNRHDE